MALKIKKLKKKSKILVRARLIAEEVELNRKEYESLSIEDLKLRTDYLVNGLANNKFTLDDIVVDAFSIAREIIYREYGMLAYTVQMMGAYVVHCGDFAEMYTGEGKTLTILLVAFLNALAKKGVHIVTVNEYLVERDAEFARKAFEKLGITVGYNNSKMNKQAKKEMFNRDITYTTNSELGFDYLRDNMVRSMEEKVIRDLFFVIIDEGDSVLIDEARTPLIISGNPKEDYSLYLDVDNIVASLHEEDYFIDVESNTISLTDSGASKVEQYFGLKNLYSVDSSEIVHKVTNALMAHYVFANGREYLVKDDKIYLIDQFTGRILEGRSYNAGLQQAIQAKERVKIEPENVVMATITYQSFFRLYKRLSAVSGTAMTEAEEFLKIYNMVVVRVPTNKPIVRIDKADYIFGTKTVKWTHVIQEIVNRHQTGQPILVGTSSVTDSEIIHQKLKELNIPHQVLNARDNSREAEIVKLAGQKGAITISTNMAGRGTDIKVTDEVRALGGLYVIGTERHESRRVDNQLRGRTGRQGDPGESRFFTSLEDSLFKRFATDRFAKASEKLEDDFFDSKFFSRMLDRTQKKVEGLNFDIRKNLMDYDHVLSLQRELVYKQRDQILLKENNLKIIFNMAKEYASNLVYSLRNKDNSAIVDAAKFVETINNDFLKFEYFSQNDFENIILDSAKEFLLTLFDIIINEKIKILSEIGADSVIGEILLVNLDQKWTNHIDKMTKLREGVNLRSLEQRSPLNIYIEDGNNLFEKMKSDVVRDVINGICRLSLPNETNLIYDALDKSKIKEFDKKKVQNFFIEDNQSQSSNLIDEKIDYDNQEYVSDNDSPMVEELVENQVIDNNYEVLAENIVDNNIEDIQEEIENEYIEVDYSQQYNQPVEQYQQEPYVQEGLVDNNQPKEVYVEEFQPVEDNNVVEEVQPVEDNNVAVDQLVENEFTDNQEEFTPDVYVDEYINEVVANTNIDDQYEKISDDLNLKPTGAKLSELKPRMDRYNPKEELAPKEKPQLFNPFYSETDVENVLTRNYDELENDNKELFEFEMWDDEKNRARRIYDDNFAPVLINSDRYNIRDIDINHEENKEEFLQDNLVLDQDDNQIINEDDSINNVENSDLPIVAARSIIDNFSYPTDIEITPHIINEPREFEPIDIETLSKLKKDFTFVPRQTKNDVETEIIKETAKNYYAEKFLENKNKKSFDQQLMELIVEKSKNN